MKKIAIAALIFVVLAIIGSLVAGSNKPKNTTSKTIAAPASLNASASKSLAGIEITNNENVAWNNCKLKLNDKWQHTLGNPLAPKDPLDIPYTLFTQSDGSRFDTSTTQAKNLYIQCTVNGQSRNNYFLF